MCDDIYWMKQAIELAESQIPSSSEIPVAAILVRESEMLSFGVNKRIASSRVSAHAEIIALESAGQKIGDWRIPGATMYVTLEPCPMCLGAIIDARIERIVFSCFDYKNGALGGKFNMLEHLDKRGKKIEVVTGIKADKYKKILADYFQKLR